ncbi:DNA replication complex GINS protein SLD5 [Andrographis paniculata]|uniref:DNA replication complex GINS protein SLD5 n=1 Tax=Andrographis paniculata TaxID=175694 RepID=UPI0021E7F199|nr:DNA replication complex GINS protein SLD5 [Andrographis paniculata]XP_051113605.1 DNA replication complex GINS protein SLD5 [Andrographis paniculata]XP_051113606.1 DNA replication complex GINS protein SLD5 [Andrographis paniculata]XP_051113607.1 DNA replication complex GINS protein SLD5 [Andrographis paniculata]
MDASAELGSAADNYNSLMSTTDAELLKTAWRNEKAAPEILKFDSDLVQRSRQQLHLMEEMVNDFNSNGVDPLTVSLYQMDLDRTMFLLRSYVRTRLQKIEKYVFHINKTTELWNRLSMQEQRFARRCAGDLTKNLEQSVLSKLPEQYQSHLRQSAASEDDDMVPEPRLDAYVVCRSKRYLGAFQLDDGEEEPINIEADDLYALPYKSIKPLVENGQIDLV